MDLRVTLQAQLAARKQRNARYSLRAFARDLGTDHASLSQILRGRRALTAEAVTRFGGRLGLARAEITAARRHAENASVVKLLRSARARPDSRWIATQTGLPLHTVNVVLQRLLQRRELVMESKAVWRIAPEVYG